MVAGVPSEIPIPVDGNYGNYSLAHTILFISSPGYVSRENHNIQNTLMFLKCIHPKLGASQNTIEISKIL